MFDYQLFSQNSSIIDVWQGPEYATNLFACQETNTHQLLEINSYCCYHYKGEGLYSQALLQLIKFLRIPNFLMVIT